MVAARQNKTAIIAITKTGAQKARLLRKALQGSELYLPEKFREKQDAESVGFGYPVKLLLKQVFSQYKRIVLFMAAGAAVRLLAMLVKTKEKDPAVVVVDQEGKFAISLLSGHLGGANDLAEEVALTLGGTPVITTASDSSGILSPDMIGREFGWKIENKKYIKLVSAALVNGEKVGVYQDSGEPYWLPDDKQPANLVVFDNLGALRESDCKAAMIITDRVLTEEDKDLLKKAVLYRPGNIVVGIGCRRWTCSGEIETALTGVLGEKGLSLKSVRNLATVDIKSDEEGINLVARKYGWPVEYYSKEQLSKYYEDHRGTACCARSETVFRRIGAPGVCEPAALISSGGKELLLAKTIVGKVTIALARVAYDDDIRVQHAIPQCIENGNKKLPKEKGKLYLVGLGPGYTEQMTERARKALEDSAIILGYKSYLRQIDGLLAGKEVISSGMGNEVDRAQKAIALAGEGKKVALVSGGDAGIYGMAGLAFELLQNKDKKTLDGFECEVVPGVPALNAAASLLGAPLMCDFAAINLSDLLVSWDCIALRLEKAAQADFVIVIYNPASHKRKDQIGKAREILLKHRDAATPVGVVSDAYREDQKVVLTDLKHMLDYDIGMNTLIIVGNSTTFQLGNWLVTPRGYSSKYKIRMSKSK